MTNIFAATPENIKLAAETIKKGGLVAFPTDTVYGLGANAYNSDAVAKIFAAKERPSFDPLISHIAEIDFLPEFTQTDSRVMDLARHFWPGPLTFVLNRKDKNHALDMVCSGLPKIAVRMPNTKIALELIKNSETPISAPSANKFKTISPTTAHHVFNSLGDSVDMILDGGRCAIGVETTIIDLTEKEIIMLRAGGLSKEDLEAYTGEKVIISQGTPNKPSSPGQLLKHYAPTNCLRINVTTPNKKEFYIGFGNTPEAHLNLSPKGDLREAAANLFAYLRFADRQEGFDGIAIAPIPETDLGLAINDRIKRASYKE